MTTNYFNVASVSEMTVADMQETNGGWLREAIACACDVCENWSTYVSEFKKGFNQGRKIL
jgi:hypothetical protein